jgi:hypothetical protein
MIEMGVVVVIVNEREIVRGTARGSGIGRDLVNAIESGSGIELRLVRGREDPRRTVRIVVAKGMSENRALLKCAIENANGRGRGKRIVMIYENVKGKGR